MNISLPRATPLFLHKGGINRGFLFSFNTAKVTIVVTSIMLHPRSLKIIPTILSQKMSLIPKYYKQIMR